jgi:hypothetical protein
LLKNGAAPHSILQSRALETPEHERGDASMETNARGFLRGAVARTALRKVAGSHRAQG